LFNGRIELAYSSTFRVLAFSLLIGALSPGSFAPAFAQDNKQPAPAAPAAVPQSTQRPLPPVSNQRRRPFPMWFSSKGLLSMI
jgi:hypothetical protein